MSGSGGVPVFLSWSGARSKAAAEALKVALPRCIQTVRPWMSDTDVQAGSRWFDEIGNALQTYSYCIAVLTADNLESPWIHFEAGAISKAIGTSHVAPYLVGIEPEHVRGPLQQFNGVPATRDGTLKLVTGLHSALGPDAPALDLVMDAFDSAWPRLEAALADLPEAISGPPPPPDEPELLERMDGRLHAIERALAQVAVRQLRTPPAPLPIAVGLDSTLPEKVREQLTRNELLEIEPGDLVEHAAWGLGWVIDVRGTGDKSEITIGFDTVGEKTLLLVWSPLRKLRLPGRPDDPTTGD